MCSSKDHYRDIIEVEGGGYDSLTVIGVTEIVEEDEKEDYDVEIEEWCTGYILSVFGFLWVIVPIIVLSHRCVLVYWWRTRKNNHQKKTEEDFISTSASINANTKSNNNSNSNNTNRKNENENENEKENKKENIQWHPYMMAICEDDFYRRNILIVYMTTVFTSAAFIIAILCSIEYPADDGTCNKLYTEKSCLSNTAMLSLDIDSSMTMKHCEWDVEYSECNYLQNPVDAYHILVIVLLVAVCFTPIVFLIDIIFYRILLAPSPSSSATQIEEEEEDKDDKNNYNDTELNESREIGDGDGETETDIDTDTDNAKANEIAIELGSEIDRLLLTPEDQKLELGEIQEAVIHNNNNNNNNNNGDDNNVDDSSNKLNLLRPTIRPTSFSKKEIDDFRLFRHDLSLSLYHHRSPSARTRHAGKSISLSLSLYWCIVDVLFLVSCGVLH